MSKKVSAFQVYSEEQTHQRHSRSYRAHSPTTATQSGRLAGMDWRDSLKGSAGRSMARHSSSPEGRADRSHTYDTYDSRRDDHHTAARDTVTRYRDDGRHGDKDPQVVTGTRYRSDGQYDRYNWDSREDRRDDYTTTTTTTTSRDRGSLVHKDDYLSVGVQRQVPASNAPASYSDSDEECLHENLRRKKTTVNQFSTEVVDDRRWSSDDDYNNYRQARKRALSGASYHSHSPEQQPKDWRDRHFSPPQHDPQHPRRSYSPESDREYHHSPPTKKKKAKSGKKTAKVKEKKQKAAVALAVVQQPQTVVVAPASAGKIQSLMDVKIPSSVKKQVELASSSATTAISKFGEGRPEYKFNANSEDSAGRSLARSSNNHHGDSRTTSSRYDDTVGSRSRSHYDDYYHQDSHRSREPAFGGGRRDSESDRHGNHHHHSSHSHHKDSYSSRHSPDYSHRSSYHHNDDYDRGGGRDRQRRSSFSRGDGRGNGESRGGSSKRKRPSSTERRDWPRSGGRMSQRERDRSPDYSSYSDSDQDSDRGGRRSWRDERRERDRQKKDDDREREQKGDRKKDDDRDRELKGDKKSKTKVEAEPKSSQRSKKSSTSTTTSKKEASKDPEPHSRMEVMPCKDGLAVFLTHPQTVCLRGRAKLWVFAGEIKVMGYPVEAKGSTSYDLFSLSTSSLITINTVNAEKEKKALRKAVQSLGLEDKVVKDFLSGGSGAVVLLASKLDFPAADYICTHPPFTQLFRYNFDRAPIPGSVVPTTPEVGKVGAAFLATEQATVMYLKESEEFEAALNKWSTAVKSAKSPSPVGLLCGGVNSGKSTFSRYMVNASLACVPKVCYLDCDVGQTEFSPPGTIALTVLDSPIFGPPFCHQKIPERMCFYGLVNPAEGPSYYVQCVEYVLEAYKQMENPPPLVVNTMGWNKDMGLHLFLDVLHLVSPDLVVQFSLSSDVLNFPPITPHFVAHQPGWIYNTQLRVEEEEGEEKSETPAKKTHEHVTIQSLVSSRNDPTRVKLTSKNLRDLALLGHLMLGFCPGLTLTSAPPYTVPWGRLGLYVHHGHSLAGSTIDSLRAGIVALCSADLSQASRVSEDSPLMFKEPPVCECFGYGLVREVCHESRTLKVVTAMGLDRLAQVNTLIKGTVSTPDQLPLKQGHMEDVPFIDALEPAMALAPVRPRTRMPRRSRI